MTEESRIAKCKNIFKKHSKNGYIDFYQFQKIMDELDITESALEIDNYVYMMSIKKSCIARNLCCCCRPLFKKIRKGQIAKILSNYKKADLIEDEYQKVDIVMFFSMFL